MANEIMVIHPYKYNGMWVFDDPSVDLDKEPFVAGADIIIDKLVEDLVVPENGFNLVFSKKSFPGHQYKFKRLQQEFEGFWYQHPGTGMQGWLCPALFKYFDEAPETLFVRIISNK